jgi:hypothetical protein
VLAHELENGAVQVIETVPAVIVVTDQDLGEATAGTSAIQPFPERNSAPSPERLKAPWAIAQAVVRKLLIARHYRLNFEPTSFQVAGPRGGARSEPLYCVTAKGLSELGMSLTGNEARFIRTSVRTLLRTAPCVPVGSCPTINGHVSVTAVSMETSLETGRQICRIRKAPVNQELGPRAIEGHGLTPGLG